MSEPTGGISVSVETLKEKYDEIVEIDSQLDLIFGSESAGKIAVGNKLMESTKDSWTAFVSELETVLNGLTDPAEKAGFYTGIRKSLHEKFNTEVDSFLAEQAEKNKQDAVKPSDEEITALTTGRKELVDQYNALRGILEMFGRDVSSVPPPKKRTGARGKRGKRVLKGYTYFIDGKERTATQNNLSSIAATVCKPLSWSTMDLRNWLTEQGLDLENPPDEFEYRLPAPVGKMLRGEAGETEADEEEEDDEEEENEDQ